MLPEAGLQSFLGWNQADTENFYGTTRVESPCCSYSYKAPIADSTVLETTVTDTIEVGGSWFVNKEFIGGNVVPRRKSENETGGRTKLRP